MNDLLRCLSRCEDDICLMRYLFSSVRIAHISIHGMIHSEFDPVPVPYHITPAYFSSAYHIRYYMMFSSVPKTEMRILHVYSWNDIFVSTHHRMYYCVYMYTIRSEHGILFRINEMYAKINSDMMCIVYSRILTTLIMSLIMLLLSNTNDFGHI